MRNLWSSSTAVTDVTTGNCLLDFPVVVEDLMSASLAASGIGALRIPALEPKSGICLGPTRLCVGLICWKRIARKTRKVMDPKMPQRIRRRPVIHVSKDQI
jgi:hypothetical protein